jgi:cell division protein FtsB
MSQELSPNRQRTMTLLLLVLLALVGILTYFTLDQSSNIDGLEEEKVLLITQLEDYKRDLTSQSSANDSLNAFIAQETSKLNEVISKIQQVNFASKAKIKSLRNEVFSMRKHISDLTEDIDSVNREYAKIIEIKDSVQADLDAELVKSSSLEKKVEKGAKLQLSSIEASAYRINGKGIEKATNSASKANRIKACMTIAKNDLSVKGEKTLFLRINTPDNRVLATTEKQKTMLVSGEKMIYSSSQVINYNGSPTGCCLSFNIQTELKSGSYVLAIYTSNEKIGEARLTLQ